MVTRWRGRVLPTLREPINAVIVCSDCMRTLTIGYLCGVRIDANGPGHLLLIGEF